MDITTNKIQNDDTDLSKKDNGCFIEARKIFVYNNSHSILLLDEDGNTQIENIRFYNEDLNKNLNALEVLKKIGLSTDTFKTLLRNKGAKI